jgi:hypothetical protein
MQQRAQEYGIDARAHFWQALGRSDRRRGTGIDAQAALDFARQHTTERESVIDRRALEATAVQHGMSRTDLASVRTEITAGER